MVDSAAFPLPWWFDFPARRETTVFSPHGTSFFKVLAKGTNPKKVKVSEIASKPVACIDKDIGF